jgi:tetratricopeptide (TPR) repeat protein
LATYDAFISYSHARDKAIAATLQTVVQRLGKPWYQRRALRVFRDDTSLSATPHLWPAIEGALGASRFLIVLASPEAAASPWVGKEISYWLKRKSVDTLLIALTEGSLAWSNELVDFIWSEATPLPAVLKAKFPTEPKWVDLSVYRAGASTRDARFSELAADFAAAIRGVPKEDLLSEELRQQRRALRQACAAAAALLVLAGLAAWQWRAASVQRDRAENALMTAARTSDSLIYDLAFKFRDQRGMPVELVLDILGRAQAMQRQLAQAGETNPELRHLEAAALGELSTTLLSQGEPQGARAAAERARAISEDFAKAEPQNPQRQRELAVNINKIGDAEMALGLRAEAGDRFRKALGIMEQLVAQEADNSAYLRDLTACLTRIGAVLAVTGQPSDALAVFGRAQSILEGLVAREPGNVQWQSDLSSAYNRTGLTLVGLGRTNEALDAYRHGLTIREKIADADGKNTQRQRDVFLSHTRIGDLLASIGRREEALASYRKALAIIEKLALSDPSNTLWQDEFSSGYDHVGDMLMLAAASDEALQLFQKSRAIRERLVIINPPTHLGSASWLSVRTRLARHCCHPARSSRCWRSFAAASPGSRRWSAAIRKTRSGNAIFPSATSGSQTR